MARSAPLRSPARDSLLHLCRCGHQTAHLAGGSAGQPASQGRLPLPGPIDAQVVAEEHLWWAEVQEALSEAVSRLPDRSRRVIVAAYGLGGQPPRSLAAIGRECGVTREAVRHWRNDALLLLRLPAFSGRLRGLCGQNTRAAYVGTQALNRDWLRRKRGRRR